MGNTGNYKTTILVLILKSLHGERTISILDVILEENNTRRKKYIVSFIIIAQLQLTEIRGKSTK